MNTRRWLASSIPLLVMAIGIALIDHLGVVMTLVLVSLSFVVGALVCVLDAATRGLRTQESHDQAVR